jgi:hypothetical protein
VTVEDNRELWTSAREEYALLRSATPKGNEGDYLIIHKKTMTALIIEDETENLQVIKNMLASGVEIWDEPPKGRCAPKAPSA